jgi:hypothetical protein
MKIPKPTEGDRERFTALVPEAPQVEVKPMFGNLGAFVNGNMFMGLFGSDVGIELPEDDQQRLLAEPAPARSARKSAPWPDTSPSQPTGPQTPRTTGSADHWPTWLACRRRSLRRPRNHAVSPPPPLTRSARGAGPSISAAGAFSPIALRHWRHHACYGCLPAASRNAPAQISRI